MSHLRRDGPPLGGSGGLAPPPNFRQGISGMKLLLEKNS